MAGQRTRDTAFELAVRKIIFAEGLRYRVNLRPSRTLATRADMVFRKARIAIYLDSCFWHGCAEHGSWPKRNARWWEEKIKRNISRDRLIADVLSAEGWHVHRFWAHEPPSTIAASIIELVAVAGPRKRAT